MNATRRPTRVTPFAPIACVLVLAASAPPIIADIVVLRDGTRIEGTVRTTTHAFEIKTKQGDTVTVRHAEVQRIERAGDRPEEDFAITDALRERVRRHERLKALGAALARGGTGAAQAAAELIKAGPDALPFLAAALGSDRDGAVDPAIRALGSIGSRPATAAIAEHLGRLEPEHQVAALEQLGAANAVHTIPAIDALLRAEDTRVLVRQAAVKSLGHMRDPLAVTALVAALGKAATAHSAARALIARGDSSAVPYLDRIVAFGAAGSRAAGRVIGQIAGPEHVRFLSRFRRAGPDAMRDAHATALARLKASRTDCIATYIALLRAGGQAEALVQLPKLTKRTEADAKAWMEWWQKYNRSRVRIAVVPIGQVDAVLLRLVQRAIEVSTNVKTALANPVAPSRWARAAGSRRLRGDALLDQLGRITDHPQVIAAVGMTPAQVEMPGAGPVIGAFRYGSCGLVSLPGLEADDAARLRARAVRHALHVLARALRVTRVDAAECPARAVYEASELDGLADRYSKETAGLIETSVSASAALLACDVKGALDGLRMIQNSSDPKHWPIEAAVLAERSLNLKLASAYWKAASRAATDNSERTQIDARVELIEKLAGF